MTLRGLLATAALIATVCHIIATPSWAQDRAEGAAALVDHQGRPATFDDFLGDFVLLFFGYTHCPDICPTDLAVLAEAVDRLGDRGARVQPVFVTIDPERDTVAVMAAYVALFHPRLIGLIGAPAAVAALAERFRVRYAKVDAGAAEASSAYLLDHTAASYLLGPDGRVLGLFRHGTPAADIAAAIAPLLDQDAR